MNTCTYVPVHVHVVLDFIHVHVYVHVCMYVGACVHVVYVFLARSAKHQDSTDNIALMLNAQTHGLGTHNTCTCTHGHSR